MRIFSAVVIVIAITAGVEVTRAAEGESQTLVTTRGKQLFADELKTLDKPWSKGKGKWEAQDGGLRGVEIKDEKHGAVMRRSVPFQDAVIQYSFKLDGARMTSLSINDSTGHLCRVIITPAGYSVRKDDHDKDGPDKAAELGNVKTAIKPGEWHTVVIELCGNEMLARIDNLAPAFGAHDALAVKKANIGLTVAGDGVVFKDFKMWEASPSPAWAAEKVKLSPSKK